MLFTKHKPRGYLPTTCTTMKPVYLCRTKQLWKVNWAVSPKQVTPSTLNITVLEHRTVGKVTYFSLLVIIVFSKQFYRKQM